MNKLINGEPTTAGTTRTTRTSGATIVASTEPIREKEAVAAGYTTLKNSLISDSTTYTCTEFSVPDLADLREFGYVPSLLRQLFKQVGMSVSKDGDSLVYKLSGASEIVGNAITFLKFMSSLPDKKFGILFKLHSRLTSSPDLLARLINTSEKLTKGKVWSFDSTAPDICKYLFVPGYMGQETHAKLQKHLNVLVKRLEEADGGVTGEVEEEEEEVKEVGEVMRYGREEMLGIRQEINLATRHAELENCTVQVQVIRLNTPTALPV
eukprot:sb/3468293/